MYSSSFFTTRYDLYIVMVIQSLIRVSLRIGVMCKQDNVVHCETLTLVVRERI